MFKNALVSVSDKSGLIEFLTPLVKNGMRVVSTGGTFRFLKENQIPVVEVSNQTGFPEVMDGRVRTLHPRIHMPLLARDENPEDMELLKKEGLDSFDLVVGNLYPFAEALAKNLPENELIEFIDIGGPALLRAAAKNFSRIAVVCDPKDYKWIAEKGSLTIEDRKRLAAKLYAKISTYDSMIARYLADEFPEDVAFGGHKIQELRYGENPHQAAHWYQSELSGLHQAQILQGKELSYNNLLDLNSAIETVQEFTEISTVAVKHNNPCGVASGFDVGEAAGKALSADPVSVFGGIVAFNSRVDKIAAEKMSNYFLECVIAPDFTHEALETLGKKKNMRVLRWPQLNQRDKRGREIRFIRGGFLIQTIDQVASDWRADFSFHGSEPDAKIRNDLLFAWKICAHLKSNAICIVTNRQTLGLGMGQVNRVDAVEQAIHRMQKHHPQAECPVLASDAFFPFADSIERAAQAGIKWIIQPGGSLRDEEVFAKAKELGVNLIITHQRHFRH